jgi:formamidopyrimidine-DNA glycosylase
MPELPEVESIVTSLQPLIGKTICQVVTSNKTFRIRAIEKLESFITNKQINSIKRKSKYIIIDLNCNYYLILHLGMSGKILSGINLKRNLHDHLIIFFTDGNELIFNDPRRFGLYTLIHKNKLSSHPLFRHLGVEPLTHKFSYSYLTKILSRKSSQIKTILMDATKIVGIGNIYASESLFRAKILPNRIASSISPAEIKKLCHSIKEVLNEAIAAGGSTLKDYVISTGETGLFQNNFRVYGRKGKECYVCRSMIHHQKIAGRSTFYCTQCQI